MAFVTDHAVTGSAGWICQVLAKSTGTVALCTLSLQNEKVKKARKDNSSRMIEWKA